MKILHVSDFHANMRWFDWLRQAAVHYDLICLAGDLLDARQPETIADQMRGISAVLGRISTKSALCSGNHDMVHADGAGHSALWVRDLARPEVWSDGDRFELLGRKFYCHPWMLPTPTAAPDDIWIIHSPPEGTATSQVEGGDFDHGDFEFAELCASGQGPLIALCGHIHQAQSWHDTLGRTLILNPGHSADPSIPAHIILDLEQRVATWHFPGRASEAIPLPGPPVNKILKTRTAGQIDDLVEITVSNQRAEGIRMSVQEIEETRLRLRRLLYEQ